jgi:hypothetical protein
MVLKEELIPANLDLLKSEMGKDKELETFLTTPAKNLPNNYKYLVQDVNKEIEEYSLYDLIYASVLGKYTGFTEKWLKPMFSTINGKPVGFVAYEENGDSVTEIKMFSFNPKQGTVLMRDLIILLNDLVSKYKQVSWTAFEGNPANRFYQKAMEKYDGTINKDGNKIRYTINNNLITEELVPANINLLKDEMKKDKNLETFLTTPAKDLPTKYHYLVSEIGDFEDYCLYDLIFWSLTKKIQGTLHGKFSMSNGKPIGWCGYIVENGNVTEIKMFSFNPNSGTILIRDLMLLLEKLVKEYPKVSWTAFKGNPANRIYQKAMKKYNGKIMEYDNKIVYLIQSDDIMS